MDEVSSYVCLVLPSTDGKAARKIVPPRLRIPYWKGLGADSEEKHEPVSDIDTVVVDSLKALDPKRPISEADIRPRTRYVRFVPTGDMRTGLRNSPTQRLAYGRTAIAEISTFKSRGKRATSTVARAGGASLK